MNPSASNFTVPSFSALCDRLNGLFSGPSGPLRFCVVYVGHLVSY